MKSSHCRAPRKGKVIRGVALEILELRAANSLLTALVKSLTRKIKRMEAKCKR